MAYCGVFTTNQKYADYLIKGIKNSNNYKVKYYSKSKNNIILELENGNKYIWINPTNKTKVIGKRVQSAYIDINTCDINLLHKIKIYACINVNKKDFHIVDSREFNGEYVSYDLDVLIDRLKKIRFIKGNINNIYFCDSEFGDSQVNSIEVDIDNKLLFSTY